MTSRIPTARAPQRKTREATVTQLQRVTSYCICRCGASRGPREDVSRCRGRGPAKIDACRGGRSSQRLTPQTQAGGTLKGAGEDYCRQRGLWEQRSGTGLWSSWAGCAGNGSQKQWLIRVRGRGRLCTPGRDAWTPGSVVLGRQAALGLSPGSACSSLSDLGQVPDPPLEALLSSL